MEKYCPGFYFQVPCTAVDIKSSIFIAKKRGKFYMRHRTVRNRSVSSTVYLSHKYDTIRMPSIFFIQGARVIEEEIALVSPIKCPAWHLILNPVHLKRENRVSCTCGIAKFETGASYLTYAETINASIRM